MNKLLITITLLFLTATTFANFHLPTNANYPGGIAVIKLNTHSLQAPKVFFHNHRTLVKKNKKSWIAIVGIPLKTKSTVESITIETSNNKRQKESFPIRKRIYPLRHITIKDKSKVTPNPKLAKKIKHQRKLAQTILSTWTPQKNVPIQFIIPSQGWFSSYFGLRRIYNKVRHGRHTGLDVAIKAGSPIVAAANGTVLAVEDFILTGNTVYVNHGQGLITMYAHMQSVDVKPGEQVRQGEKLGAVGSTGRVTGPHLHWEVSLNGIKVNPTLFVPHLQKKSKPKQFPKKARP